MCGIAGFIGRSVNQRVSFELAHALLVKTEIRGDHATGFWGCERGNGRIYYDKEPTKSTEYVKRDIWVKDFARVSADLLITHCRYSSVGVGHEKFNKNNHPHVSSDCGLALVHNGKIPEYNTLKGRYDLSSDCDSEILLRMFESSKQINNEEAIKELGASLSPPMSPFLAERMLGLREIFARVNYGAMAVAIAERGNDGSRYLWLFRDDERPLHVVDMRKTLGQVFFCSTAEIWRSATDAVPSVKSYIAADQSIIEFPSSQIWMMAMDGEGNWTIEEDPGVRKFKITKTKFHEYNSNDDEGVKFVRKPCKPCAKLITRLGKDDEVATNDGIRVVNPHPQANVVVNREKNEKKNPPVVDDHVAEERNVIERSRSVQLLDAADAKTINSTVPDTTEIDMEAFENLVDDIKKASDDIKTSVQNMKQEGSIDEKNFELVMSSLKDAHAELQATLVIIRP